MHPHVAALAKVRGHELVDPRTHVGRRPQQQLPRVRVRLRASARAGARLRAKARARIRLRLS